MSAPQDPEYELKLMDWAAKIGSQAKVDGVKKSQIEQLIGSAELLPAHAPLITAAFASRQAARLGGGHNTARMVAQAMIWLHKQNKDKAEVRRLLGLAKWVYECVENRRIPNVFNSFNEFVQFLASEGRGRG